MRFLFWNTNKKVLDDYIADIIEEQHIDVFCAAEYAGNIDNLCDRLKRYKLFEEVFSPNCERITILGNPDVFIPGFQNKYCSMQIINDEYLLCAVHLPSQLHNDNIRREEIIREIVFEIDRYENNSGVTNTFIVGDFNVNPYEDACLSINQFHSIPVDFESERNSRCFAGKTYKMFYNPMWNLFGDKEFPPGTYYYDSGSSICPYWNIYDQVLIRPSLIRLFKKEQLKIVTECKNEPLINTKSHPRKDLSDHLPIVFELEV